MYLNIKRLVDKIVSFFLILILFPLIILISLLIYLEDFESPFFISERIGFKGKIFKIFKFRTMVIDSHKYLDQYRMPKKNRCTRIGNFLRLFGLDELPQLINIFKGEMSFIGPKPILPEYLKYFSKNQKIRFIIKPGITGLAQVNGRNEILWSERVKFDIFYVKNVSLKLDLIINYSVM